MFLYGFLYSHVACTLLLAGTASHSVQSLVAFRAVVVAVHQHDLVRPKVKMDIYPDEHSPRRSQAFIAGVKLLPSLADVSAKKQVQELKSRQAEMSFSKI